MRLGAPICAASRAACRFHARFCLHWPTQQPEDVEGPLLPAGPLMQALCHDNQLLEYWTPAYAVSLKHFLPHAPLHLFMPCCCALHADAQSPSNACCAA